MLCCLVLVVFVALYDIALHCVVLYDVVLPCIVLCRIALSCSASLFCFP